MKKRVNYNILELTHRNQFVPARGFDKKIELFKIKKNAGFNYAIPFDNTLKHDWWEHLSFNKRILDNNLAFPEVHFFLALHEGQVIGSFDLILLPDRAVEIKNFGLSSQFHDFELRAMFLSKTVDYCFQLDPKRIFYQTSEFDKMSALSNYLSQGFAISTHGQDIDESSKIKEKSDLLSDFLVNLN